MPYYDVANCPKIITKTNIIVKMTCGCGTLKTDAVKIEQHVQCLPQSCAVVSAPLEISYRSVWRFQPNQNLAIL